MEVIFEDRQDFKKFDDSLMDKIKSVISACLEYEDYDSEYDVSLSFVTNDEIREINRDFRGIDKVTDVLSFPMITEDDFEIEYEEFTLGDIVVSIERADEQAREFGHSIEREICFLVCHSMFHLLGYDHMEDDEAKEMQAKEKYVLDSLGITRDMSYEG